MMNNFFRKPRIHLQERTLRQKKGQKMLKNLHLIYLSDQTAIPVVMNLFQVNMLKIMKANHFGTHQTFLDLCKENVPTLKKY